MQPLPTENTYKFTLEDAKDAFPIEYLKWWEANEREKHRLETDTRYWIEQQLMHRLSTVEVAELFKNRKGVRVQLKELVKELKDELSKYPDIQRLIERTARKSTKASPAEIDLCIWFYGMVCVKLPREETERKLKRLSGILMFLSNKKTALAGSKSQINLARQVSIDSFIEFNSSGFASCIWHNDGSPSMKWYSDKNTVWCFGCNRGGDTIDVVQQVYDVDFNKALSIILN
jgi:hypothetical protein